MASTVKISGIVMRRAERLFRLVNEMRTRSVSRAEDLAAQFEVSIRTIYRDIAHLQGSGLPIEGEAGVGYLLRPGFDLPPVTFTNDQIDALAVALSFAESLDDPSLASAAKEVRAKIQASLPLPEMRQLADAPFYSLRRSTGAPEHASALRRAIRLRRVVRMTYTNGQGQRTERLLRPLAIWNFDEGWMFSAWCDLRQTFRTFRFDRVTQLLLTDQVFDKDDSKSLQAFLQSDRCRA
jgi:predicted DNA-binding transcriptional regulator YafY